MLHPAGIKAVVATGIGWLVASHITDTGTTLFDYVTVGTVMAGALTYAALQIRDYRPNKRLREDNAELRRDNDRLERDMHVANGRVDELAKSRDFAAAFAEAMRPISEASIRATQEHSDILRAVERQAAALETVAQHLTQEGKQ